MDFVVTALLGYEHDVFTYEMQLAGRNLSRFLRYLLKIFKTNPSKVPSTIVLSVNMGPLRADCVMCVSGSTEGNGPTPNGLHPPQRPLCDVATSSEVRSDFVSGSEPTQLRLRGHNCILSNKVSDRVHRKRLLVGLIL